MRKTGAETVPYNAGPRCCLLVPVTTQRLERGRGVPHPSRPGSTAPLPRAGVLCSSSTGPRWVLWAAEERRGLSAAGSHNSSHQRSVCPTQEVSPKVSTPKQWGLGVKPQPAFVCGEGGTALPLQGPVGALVGTARQ